MYLSAHWLPSDVLLSRPNIIFDICCFALRSPQVIHLLPGEHGEIWGRKCSFYTYVHSVRLNWVNRESRDLIVLSHWPHVATHVATQVAAHVASVKGLGHKSLNLLPSPFTLATCTATSLRAAATSGEWNWRALENASATCVATCGQCESTITGSRWETL